MARVLMKAAAKRYIPSQAVVPEGFLREVSSAELISGNDLASLVGLTSGTPHNSDAGWLKFNDGGVIKYIAKKTFRYQNITPAILDGLQLRKDNRIITIGGKQYVIRCISGTPNGGPVTYVNDNSYPVELHASEWGRLMMPFIEGNASNKEWDTKFTLAELGITGAGQPGAYTLMREVKDISTFWMFVGQTAIDRVHVGNASGIPVLRGWRPLLEEVA